MDLYLLRHADAEKPDPHQDDSKRALTAKGEQQSRSVGNALLRLEVSFDAIFTSPYRRAMQTAEIVAGALESDELVEACKPLAPEGNGADLVREIADRKPASVLLVGHEPDMSQFISTLLVGRPNLPLTMKKGGLCKLSIESLNWGACASLEWLVPPEVVAEADEQ